MGTAKRHHWWPVVQSRHWTNKNGQVAVTRANGTTFRANPLNLGVESELYTRFGPDDSKDLAIEEWFATAIDGLASTMIEHLLDPANTREYRFSGDPRKADVLRKLGYRVRPFVSCVALDANVRRCIARYLAALLVRHPTYLAKLERFHAAQGRALQAKNQALDNMLELFELYAKRIQDADLMVVRRTCAAELLYADGGLVIDEPWRTTHGIPFDLHAPLTPDLAIEVLPLPNGMPRNPWGRP